MVRRCLTTAFLAVVVAFHPASASTVKSVGGFTFTCHEAGSFAQNVYDARKAGNSLTKILRAIEDEARGNEPKVAVLQGIATTIYGDRSLSRMDAYRVTYDACAER